MFTFHFVGLEAGSEIFLEGAKKSCGTVSSVGDQVGIAHVRLPLI